jgi:hypothetical protein
MSTHAGVTTKSRSAVAVTLDVNLLKLRIHTELTRQLGKESRILEDTNNDDYEKERMDPVFRFRYHLQVLPSFFASVSFRVLDVTAFSSSSFHPLTPKPALCAGVIPSKAMCGFTKL